ncbi:MAG: hypothetical protein NTZ87_02075 [Candidatus Nomurabacteria bacterium]|nr:hypothetical protein [Candidatus Nomurabacteria bacterium]
MNKKIIWRVIVAIVIIAGGFAYNYLSKPKPVCWPYCPGMTDQDREAIKKSALEAETANWKTYTNTKYGFEVKYPVDWRTEETKTRYGSTIFSLALVSPETDDFIKKVPGTDASTFDVDFMIYPLNYRSNGVRSQVVFNGINAEKVVSESELGTHSIIYLDGKNYTYGIYNISPRNIEENDQILSTFKFIEPTTQIDTSNWKTYTNEKYGFSLSYPTDFENVNDLTATQQNSLLTYMAVCLVGNNNSRIRPDQSGFCYVGKQTSDGFTMASLNITPSVSKSAQECNNTSAQIKQTTLNGIIFDQSHLDDAGLGHYVSTDSYRTYHQGICYTIDLNIESNIGKLEKGLSVDFASLIHSKLESILSTFKFIPTANISSNDSLLKAGTDVLTALRDDNYQKLEELTSSSGLSWNEYPQLDFTKNDISKDSISDISTDNKTYMFGYTDGKGDPIVLTKKDYIKEYLYNYDYLYAEKVAVNKTLGSGNSVNSIIKDSGNRTVVAYYFSGFDAKYGGMDWTTLYLVFDKENGVYKLCGIAKDNWTI